MNGAVSGNDGFECKDYESDGLSSINPRFGLLVQIWVIHSRLVECRETETPESKVYLHFKYFLRMSPRLHPAIHA